MIQINQDILNEGERHVLRDRGLLESACDKARNIWAYDRQDDVACLATCLLFGIARNHPFEQGNKRTAYTAMVGFLGINGFRIIVSDDTALSADMLLVLTGEETEEGFSDRLRRVIEKDDQLGWR